MKAKRWKQIFLSLVGSTLVIWGTGLVTAEEKAPYEAEELRLEQGSGEYDLTEGIKYNRDRYTLEIENDGGFDINVLGKYQVAYALHPGLEESTEGMKEDQSETGDEIESSPEMEVPADQPVLLPALEEGNLIPEIPETGVITGSEGSDSLEDTSALGDETAASEESTLPLGLETVASQDATPDTTLSVTKAGEEAGRSSALERLLGIVFAAERTPAIADEYQEIGLEESDGVLYFIRMVHVVPERKEMNLEYEQEELRLPSNTQLYELIMRQEAEVRSPSSAVEEKEEEGFPVKEKYELVLKNKSLILGDVYVTDRQGDKIKGAQISIKDDSSLRLGAVIQKQEEKGIRGGLEPGIYQIELSAVHPESGEEITGTREIIIEAAQAIQFDMSPLILGTKNLPYNLIADMKAYDENGAQVTVYVKDESQLLASKEMYADEESGEEKEQLKKGVYQVTMGAKHPLSGEEFTAVREVEVLDGYYIYAPDLEIKAESTEYDLLAGVEVRHTGEAGKAIATEVQVKDISELEQGMEIPFPSRRKRSLEEPLPDLAIHESFPEMEGDLPKPEAVLSEKAVVGNPPLKEGNYRVLLSAKGLDTGREITTVRRVRVARAPGDFDIWTNDGAHRGTRVGGFAGIFDAGGSDARSNAAQLVGGSRLTSAAATQPVSIGVFRDFDGTPAQLTYNWAGVGQPQTAVHHYFFPYANDLRVEFKNATGFVASGSVNLPLGRTSIRNATFKNGITMWMDGRGGDYQGRPPMLVLENPRGWQATINADMKMADIEIYTQPGDSPTFDQLVHIGSLRLDLRGSTILNYLANFREADINLGGHGLTIRREISKVGNPGTIRIDTGTMNFEGSASMNVGNFILEGTPTIYKAPGRGLNDYAVAAGMLTLNGGKVLGARGGGPREGDVFFTTGGTIDATDFKVGVPNEDAGGTWYFKNQGDKRIVFTNKQGPIEISDPTNKKTYRNTFRDALNFIRSDNKAGEYIIKLLVPRDFISADANALRDFSAANVTKLIITADTGSGMENNRHRLRSRGVTTLTMPQSTEVEFNNIAIRDIQNYDVRGGRLTFGDNVAIIGAAANVIGRVADTNIVIRSGNFNNVNGNGTASHTGTANVAVFGGTITELVGSTNKNGGISHITLNGATVGSVFDFDTLRVQGSSEVTEALLFDTNGRGFGGRVIFESGSNLRSSRLPAQIGSLETEAGTTGGTLVLGRTGPLNGPMVLMGLNGSNNTSEYSGRACGCDVYSGNHSSSSCGRYPVGI